MATDSQLSFETPACLGAEELNWGIKASELLREFSCQSSLSRLREVTWSRWRPFSGAELSWAELSWVSAVQCSGVRWLASEWIRGLLRFNACELSLLEAGSWGTGTVQKPRARWTSAVGSRYQATAMKTQQTKRLGACCSEKTSVIITCS
jgi:hypothetical protein